MASALSSRAALLVSVISVVQVSHSSHSTSGLYFCSEPSHLEARAACRVARCRACRALVGVYRCGLRERSMCDCTQGKTHTGHSMGRKQACMTRASTKSQAAPKKAQTRSDWCRTPVQADWRRRVPCRCICRLARARRQTASVQRGGGVQQQWQHTHKQGESASAVAAHAPDVAAAVARAAAVDIPATLVLHHEASMSHALHARALAHGLAAAFFLAALSLGACLLARIVKWWDD